MSHKAHINERRTKNTLVSVEKLPEIAVALGVTATGTSGIEWCWYIDQELYDAQSTLSIYYHNSRYAVVTMNEEYESAYPDDPNDLAALNKIREFLDPDFVLAFTSEYDDIWEYKMTPDGVVCNIVE